MKQFQFSLLIVIAINSLHAAQVKQLAQTQSTLQEITIKKFIDTGEVGKKLHAKMFELIKEGNLTELKALFAEKIIPDINAPQVTRYETPAIYEAVACGHDDIVEYLLDLGADVNAKNGANSTPIFAAIKESTLKLLIKAGADINKKNSNGYRPLHFIMSNTSEEGKKMRTLLLSLGAIEKTAREEAKTNQFLRSMQYKEQYPMSDYYHPISGNTSGYERDQYNTYIKKHGCN